MFGRKKRKEKEESTPEEEIYYECEECEEEIQKGEKLCKDCNLEKVYNIPIGRALTFDRIKFAGYLVYHYEKSGKYDADDVIMFIKVWDFINQNNKQKEV